MRDLPLLLILLVSLPMVTLAQDEAVDKAEDCEEAWEYMEFLKTDIKKKIEDVMQQTLFQPAQLLEKTVADTMSEVLGIRDTVLDRVKKIRTGDDSITICKEQGIKQEEFLSDLRLDVMTVLLRLIESDAATEKALQDVGRLLLAVRTKVNGRITQLIMLRETGTIVTSSGDCADCEFLNEIKVGLDEVIEGGEGEEGGKEVTMLTMLLMTIDNRIGVLYNSILAEVEEGPRAKASEELKQLKGISGNIDVILSQMVDDPENTNKIKRLVSRDCVKIRNEVIRFLDECANSDSCKRGTIGCESCGAKRIDEIFDKLDGYNISIVTLDEEDARESIRSDLITYLTSLNGEMTTLLTTKIESENGTLEQCDSETLEVINSVKAPLWMLVNTTLFGISYDVSEMVFSLQVALQEMRSKFCSDGPSVGGGVPTASCELDEIDQSYIWIDDIDKVIADSLFKLAEKDPKEARKETLLGFVTLRAAMEVRVKELYQQNLICPEESSQIKNVYSLELTNCIDEMMNPRYRFEGKSRAERVQCIKQLRVTIEGRRGDLLLGEINRRIKRRRELTRSNSIEPDENLQPGFGIDIRVGS